MTVTAQLKTKILIKNKQGRFEKSSNLNSITSILANSKLKGLEDLSLNINSVSISIGFSKGKVHYSGLTYAALASILENGTRDGRIPPRPYLERSSQIAVRRLNSEVREALRDIFVTGMSTSKTHIASQLKPIAEEAVEQTKKIIFNGSNLVVGNRLKTIQNKGRDRPWVRTGDLISNLEGFIRIR